MEDGKIGFEEEYRLMLYRHWSLYDSMYFSNYVASKLGIWKTDGKETQAFNSLPRCHLKDFCNCRTGKDELEVFLARMGFSLVQCRQKLVLELDTIWVSH